MKSILKTTLLAGLLWTSLTLAGAAAPVGTAFATPEAACQALSDALRSGKGLEALFGPGLPKLESSDPTERAVGKQRLKRLVSEGWSLSTNEGGDRVIRLGAEGWSFPVPLTKTARGWQFDTEAGIEEVANRRVGRNELAVIESCRLLMKAESLYREGQSAYTVKLSSSPGQRDGLYWPADGDQLSPLGQTFGDVATFATSRAKGDPWFGYYFHVQLTDQGYLITAWPHSYGQTGVMSFACDQGGKLYEQDLGPNGGAVIRALSAIKTDDGWSLVEN